MGLRDVIISVGKVDVEGIQGPRKPGAIQQALRPERIPQAPLLAGKGRALQEAGEAIPLG